MTVVATEPETCLFDCKLNPYKTEMLITRYCNTHPYTKVLPIDIIKIIILFFNHIIYYNLNDINNMKEVKQYDFFPGGLFNTTPNPNAIRMMFNVYTPYLWFNSLKLSIKYVSNAQYLSKHPLIITPDRIPNYQQDIYNFQFQISKNGSNTFTLGMINKWDSLRIVCVVLRIRIFSVRNNKEIERLIIMNSNDKIDIAVDIDLQISVEWRGSDIGSEIEILYILYKDNNYWSKYPYSWFSDAFDADCNEFMFYDEYKKYFDSRCFKIGDKHYYVINPDTTVENMIENIEFARFIGCFCKEIMTLSYDVLLLSDNRESIPLIETFQVELKMALRERHIHEQIVRPLRRNRNHTQRRDKTTENKRRFDYQKKVNKNHKTYCNNKKKYKYHRW